MSIGRNFGAGNETRTRDPDLGKVVLYQLSYSRIICIELFAFAVANILLFFFSPKNMLKVVVVFSSFFDDGVFIVFDLFDAVVELHNYKLQ